MIYNINAFETPKSLPSLLMLQEMILGPLVRTKYARFSTTVLSFGPYRISGSQ